MGRSAYFKCTECSLTEELCLDQPSYSFLGSCIQVYCAKANKIGIFHCEFNEEPKDRPCVLCCYDWPDPIEFYKDSDGNPTPDAPRIYQEFIEKGLDGCIDDYIPHSKDLDEKTWIAEHPECRFSNQIPLEIIEPSEEGDEGEIAYKCPREGCTGIMKQLTGIITQFD